jgi:hypothetical protein
MMRLIKAKWGILMTTAVVALALIFSPTAGNVRGDAPSEQDLSDLTVLWWQWIYSVPLSESPGFDPSGANAFENQPFDDLIFLAGTFTQQNVGNDVHGTATRRITVDSGTAFFFPLINTEWDNVVFDTPQPGTASVVKGKNAMTVPQLRANSAASVDNAFDLYCTLKPTGGQTANVPYGRVSSHPFPYFLPPGNILAAYGQTLVGTVTPAVSDGYWSYIPPLPHGTYTLKFGGALPLTGGTFYLDITYYITVN